MKHFSLLSIVIVAILVFTSCGGSHNSTTYVDRTVSMFATRASGLAEMIKFDRADHTYKYYIKNTSNGATNWSEQKSQNGTFSETDNNDGTITCHLKLYDDDETVFGTIHTVIISLNDGSAIFKSIAGTSNAYDITE